MRDTARLPPVPEEFRNITPRLVARDCNTPGRTMDLEQHLLNLKEQCWTGDADFYRRNIYSALVSSAYVRRDDSWKIAFHQQTLDQPGARRRG